MSRSTECAASWRFGAVTVAGFPVRWIDRTSPDGSKKSAASSAEYARAAAPGAVGARVPLTFENARAHSGRLLSGDSLIKSRSQARVSPFAEVAETFPPS